MTDNRAVPEGISEIHVELVSKEELAEMVARHYFRSFGADADVPYQESLRESGKQPEWDKWDTLWRFQSGKFLKRRYE